MTQTGPRSALPPLARLGLQSAGLGVALFAIGVWPTVQLGGDGALLALVAGLGVAWVGAIFGCWPTVASLRRPVAQHPIGILAGLGVRFAVTVALTIAMWLVDAVPARPFLLWVGLSQMAFLMVDVLTLAAQLRRAAEENTR